MGNSVQATEYDANMYAKIEYLDICIFLKINTLSFDFLEFYTLY
jgi:hypothetical protein